MHTPQTVSLETVLAARDKRYAAQQDLRRFGTVLSLTVLAVGTVKRSAFLDELLARCEAAVYERLSRHGWEITAECHLDEAGGAAVVFAVDAQATAVKKAMLALEDASPIGRLWDIDVLDDEGKPLSRRDFGYPARRCLCCDKDAKVCARTREHSPEAIAAAMQARYQAQQECEQLGQRLSEALLAEARLSPKPGLVDAINSGPHPDMCLAHFERSAEALAPYFAECAALGKMQARTPALLMDLRPIGLAAEAAMYHVTQGVNTHKGAIFVLGLWAAAYDTNPEKTAENIRAICANLPQEYGQGDSAGARLYREYGFTGARGEAVSGFATVRKIALPAYQKAFAHTHDREHAQRYALLALFAHNDDTTTVHRGGLAGLRWLQQHAQTLLQQTALRTTPVALIHALDALDKACTEKNLSTGGSADLLALTIFLTSHP